MEFGELVGCAWMLQQLAFWHAGGRGALDCSVEIGAAWCYQQYLLLAATAPRAWLPA